MLSLPVVTLGGTMKRLALPIAIGLCIQLAFSSPVQSVSEGAVQVKELNFVFVHGTGGNMCSFQLLSDCIEEQLPAYVLRFQQANPDTTIRLNTLKRCYPGYVGIDTWANNIAISINKHFRGKKDIILVGHSMGGKAALYAVAQNIGGLADRVAMVVTINSPIKSLDRYYAAGGGPALQYCRTGLLGSDEGVCNSLVSYNSPQDGGWVGKNKHWLAFISSERAPLGEQFDRAGIDAWPRDMDDGAIPLSAQYADGADVIYYGEHAHSDFSVLDEVAEFMADNILRYIFGGSIECSVFARDGTLERKADWLLGTDHWEDVVGEVVTSSGELRHTNKSYSEWREWEDVVGEYLPLYQRSSCRVSQTSLPFLTSVQELRWANPDDPEDSRLYLRTKAAPRNSVKVDWRIYRRGLLPEGTRRSHYEVEISDGTPLASISQVLWVTDNPRDLTIRIWSEAQSPFRWFKAEWRAYYKEIRQRKVIDEIAAGAVLTASTDS